MTLLPEKELAAVEAWYRDLQDALGFAATTDRGRVLAGVRKLKEEAVTYQEEKRVVATALGHKRWGDLYTYCVGKAGKTPAVELPDTFGEVPSGWVLGDKKPTYDVAKKRLTRTLDLVKRVWVALGEKEVVYGADWVKEERAVVEKAFTSSTDPNVFEQRCYEFITGYEEEDPTTVWVSAGEFAARSLENTEDLPAVAAFELLEFADVNGVEVTKATATWYENTANPANWWFWYLLSAYLYNEPRPTEEQQRETRESGQSAAEKGLLYRTPYNKEAGQAEGWALETSLSDFAKAYHAYKEAKGNATTHNELAKAVLLALGKTEEASQV